jgi:L-fucose mutarotase/ribose pyranase (RbsD/FucU family)
MNSIDPRDYTLPKSDIFADEYSPNTIVTSLIDLLPIDDKITPTIALEAITFMKDDEVDSVNG